MAYKKKLILLSSLIAALAVVYSMTFIFAPERRGARSAVYSWLDSRQRDRIGSIIIDGGEQPIELLRRGGAWFVLHNGTEYPARTLRVEDFIDILTRRSSFPLRATSAASHERLGVSETLAAKITVFGEEGVRAAPMLELLVGFTDPTGQEVFLRRSGQNDVRSGERRFLSYALSSVQSWFNLRLIPESERGRLDLANIQRVRVYPQPGAIPQIFTRAGSQWHISGIYVENPDMIRVDSYIRAIINTEGDDFASGISPNDPMFEHSRILLELGDGTIKTIHLSEACEETGRRFAVVSGSHHVYSLTGWAAQRLFRDAGEFERL